MLPAEPAPDPLSETDSPAALSSLRVRVTKNGATVQRTGRRFAPLVVRKPPPAWLPLVALALGFAGTIGLLLGWILTGESPLGDAVGNFWFDLARCLIPFVPLAVGLGALLETPLPGDPADLVRQSFATRAHGSMALTRRPSRQLYAAHFDGDPSGTITGQILRYGPGEPSGRARIVFECVQPHEPLEVVQRTARMLEEEAAKLEQRALDNDQAQALSTTTDDPALDDLDLDRLLDVEQTLALLRPDHVTDPRRRPTRR